MVLKIVSPKGFVHLHPSLGFGLVRPTKSGTYHTESRTVAPSDVFINFKSKNGEVLSLG